MRHFWHGRILKWFLYLRNICGSLIIVDHEGQTALCNLSRFADAEIIYCIEK